MRLPLCLGALLAAVSLPVVAADVAWIEAENPTTRPDLPQFECRGQGNASYLSGGQVAVIEVGAEKSESLLGKDGKIAAWDFELKRSGRHQIWGRIGFEWVRSDFDWRVDNGPWQTARSTDATVNLQELGFWCEIAWLKLGEMDLAAGKHSLQVRFMPLTREEKGKTVPARTLWMADCFCIADEFAPNFKYRPGVEYRTDADRAAMAHVFQMPEPADPAERTRLELSGAWQVTEWFEPVVPEATRLEGVDALPPNLDAMPWTSMAVPGDRELLRPDLELSHRLIYRTKVNVPAAYAGRGFMLDFESFSMIATVFVNGQRCGWSRNFYTGWQCDVSNAVKPGQVNDVVVVIKDRWYGIASDKDHPLGVRKDFCLPAGMMNNQGVTLGMDMPMSGNNATGLFRPLALVAAGKTYVNDVFAKPSVKRKELGLEVTLHNAGAAAANVKLENEIVPWNNGKNGAAEKTFAVREVSVPAGQDVTVNLAEGWANPKLWWPDAPGLYDVVTTVRMDGKAVDVARTRFGFREWEWNSDVFKLNGIVWNLRAAIDYGKTPEDFLERVVGKCGQNMLRLWGPGLWDLSRKQALDWFDEHGIPIRVSGIFDGEGCNYRLAFEKGKPNQPLFDHWREQLAAWVKTERNHPSVFIWSVENEVTFINSCNFGTCDTVEPEIRKGAAEVEKLDPTRPTMEDGGRCLKDQSMPVNGCHYNDRFGRELPDSAYTSRAYWYTHTEHGPWLMVTNRPIFHGECFFAAGIAPQEYSLVDGDRCFLGLADAEHAKGLYGRMLSEGWRWDGVAAFHFWANLADGTWTPSWQPVALFCRQWNWTFGGKSEVQRTLKLFNDTRFDDPIVAAWSFSVGGKKIADDSKTFHLKAGTAEEFQIAFTTPRVKERTAAELTLTCTRNGKEVFHDTRPAWVINPDAADKPSIRKSELVVIDPQGAAKARLEKRGIAVTEAAGAAQVPAGAKVVIVGADAISSNQTSDTAWLILAARGVNVLVLDQENPLRFKALPADLEVTDHSGSISFAEDLGHPAIAGLDQPDFFCWSGNHISYRNAYKKGTRGFRSLIQCDLVLGDTALAECQVNEGLLLLCQMAVGQKLASDPVAQRLFDNLVNYATAYRA